MFGELFQIENALNKISNLLKAGKVENQEASEDWAAESKTK